MDSLSEREEYEMSLYGFSIKDFKRENYRFFSNQVNKSIQFITSKFMDLIKCTNPNTANNLTMTLNQVELSILESTKSNIKHIANNEFEESLKIPENVILPTDRVQIKPTSSEAIDELEKECDELSTNLLQNATFIKHLIAELDSYNIEDLLEHENQVLMEGEKFLGMQLMNTDIVDYEGKFIEEEEEIC